MSDIFDYLAWRGDISFAESPFNEVDNVIFCQLTYINYTGIVPEVFTESVPIKDLAKADFSLHRVPDPRLYTLLDRCAESRRFRDVRLTGYVDIFKKEEDCQFCALTFLFQSGSAYVSYRGTDMSVTGLKEDFNMVYKAPIPSQPNGVKYLGKLIENLKWWDRRKQIMLGGHSKGGNVAQYTAIHSPKKVQKLISTIWSNDGPGFNEDFFPKDWSRPFIPRMKTFQPSTSIIGKLFDHQEEIVSISSSENGVSSHDPFYWEVCGTQLVRAVQEDGHTEILDRSFRDWLTHVGPEERKNLTDAIFEVLADMGIESLYEFKDFKLSQAITGIRKLSRLDADQKNALVHGLTQFNRSYKLCQ